MKKKSIWKLVSSFFLFIMAVCAILIIFSAVFINQSLLGFRLFIVKTGSMQDTIKTGELIITKTAEKGTLRETDIISFVSPDPEIFGEVNTHRIVEIKDGKYHTKGDANPEADKTPVAHEAVLGKVIWHSAVAGSIIAWGGKPRNMFFFIILPTVAVALLEAGNGAYRIKKLLGKETEEQREQY